MSWDKGADRIDELIARGLLQRVPASLQAAHLLVADARRHLQSAETIADADRQGAYALTYDAAIAQFEPPLGHLFRPFNRMRVRRNQVEYASTDNPLITADEVRRDVIRTRHLVEDFALPAIELVTGGQ